MRILIGSPVFSATAQSSTPHDDSEPMPLDGLQASPVNWIVKPEPGAKVLAVLHGGYHPPQVHAAGDARTIDLGHVYACKRGEAGFDQLDATVRQRSGKPIGHFQGACRGSVFHVGGDQPWACAHPPA